MAGEKEAKWSYLAVGAVKRHAFEDQVRQRKEIKCKYKQIKGVKSVRAANKDAKVHCVDSGWNNGVRRGQRYPLATG